MDKKSLRQKLKLIRQNLSPEYCHNNSKIITDKIINNKCFQESNNIAVYFSNQNEVNLEEVIEYIFKNNKNCFLPVLDQINSKLNFVKYTKNSKLVKNKYNIFEPEYNSQDIIDPENLDLILVPLLGFDKNFNRLGMGKGYYDKTFEFLNTNSRAAKPKLFGVAYKEQEVENIPVDDFDVKLDDFFTTNK